jgi:hypothetical protein
MLLVPVAPGDAGRAAPALGDSGIVWIAAQPDPFTVGLDPAANQLSRDGSVVGFVTAASAIDPGDIRIDPDAFTYTVATGQTRRINVTPGAVTYGNGWLDSMSADGSIVSFTTGAALVAGDSNGVGDVYVLERTADRLQRVSVDGGGNQSSDSSGPSALSADGRIVAFAGTLATAAPGRQVWLRDLDSGALELASVATDGTPAADGAELGSISDNGRFVSFWSRAANLPGGGSARPDFYIRDRFGVATMHGLPDAGVPDAAVMSGDGETVAYVLGAASDPSRPRLVHVWDRRAGIDRVLHLASPFNRQYDDTAVPLALSGDGRYVLLEVPATPSNHLAITIAAYDTWADSVAYPAVDGTGAVVPADARAGGLSADGTKVLFTSWENGIAPGDDNDDDDLFLAPLRPSDFRPAPGGAPLFAGPARAGERATRISVSPAASGAGGARSPAAPRAGG